MFFIGAEVCSAALEISRSRLWALCLQGEHTRMTPKEQVNGLQGKTKGFYTVDFSVFLVYMTCNVSWKYSPDVPQTSSHLFLDVCRHQAGSCLFLTLQCFFWAMFYILHSLTCICKIWWNEVSCWSKSILGKSNPLRCWTDWFCFGLFVLFFPAQLLNGQK